MQTISALYQLLDVILEIYFILFIYVYQYGLILANHFILYF